MRSAFPMKKCKHNPIKKELKEEKKTLTTLGHC